MKNLKLSLFLLLLTSTVFSQKNNRYIRKNKDAAIFTYATGNLYSRAIAIKDSFAFVGNSNGSLYKYNLNSGESFNLMTGRKFEEIRDLQLLNDTSLLIMQSGTHGLMGLLNHDEFIKYVFPKKGLWSHVFLDGMDFIGDLGFVMGDPKDSLFSLFYTQDRGLTWLPCEGKVNAVNGEAGFAASGTNVQVLNDSTFVFVSGGMNTRFFKSTDKGLNWEESVIPFLKDESSGAFSIYMKDEMNGVVVGGDYSNPTLSSNNVYYTTDGGKFWINAEEPVLGYRSCVIEKNGVYYACGTTGIDISFDEGKKWIPFMYGNYFTMTTDDKYLYATIPNGQFQRFELAK